MDLSEAVITDHAASQMSRRSITEAELRGVLEQPESVEAVRAGRLIARGMVSVQLLRIFVDVDRQPPEVVTACRAGKVGKYGRAT